MGTTFIPILQVNKVSHREVNWPKVTQLIDCDSKGPSQAA